MSETMTAEELVIRLSERGMVLHVRNNRLWVLPSALYKTLTAEETAALTRHRAELKRIAKERPMGLPASMPRPTKKEEPAEERSPNVVVYGYRITEEDVRDTLTNLGDEVLADYFAGRISKETAYRIAADKYRQYRQLASALRCH